MAVCNATLYVAERVFLSVEGMRLRARLATLARSRLKMRIDLKPERE